MRKCKKCNGVIEDGMMFCPECGTKYVKYDNQIYTLKDCPVLLVEQNIYIDNETAKGAITFANIGNNTVSAMAVTLKCYDQFGDELTDTVIKYSDLCAEHDEMFGEEKFFCFSDNDTRSFCVVIDKLLFEDNNLQKFVQSDFLPTDKYDYLKGFIERELQELESRIIWNAIMDWEEQNKPKIKQLDAERHKYILDKIKWEEISKQIDSIYQTKKDIFPSNLDFIAPPDVTNISDHLFYMGSSKNDSLRNVFLPDGIETIGEFAFASCTMLNHISIPGSVRVLNNSILTHCPNLSSVELQEGIIEIKRGVFYACKSLTSIIIPDSVLKISSDAFEFAGLKALYLPKHLMNIGFTHLPKDCRIVDKEVLKAEQERKAHEERFLKYWEEHADEKQQLEVERNTLQTQIIQLQEQVTPYDREKAKWQKKREADIKKKKKKKTVNKQISNLRSEQSSLGFFKGKEKKALQAQIDELNARLPKINESIEAEKKDQERTCNAKISEIEQTAKPIRDKIAAAQSRIKEIETELTKDR